MKTFKNTFKHGLYRVPTSDSNEFNTYVSQVKEILDI